MVPVCVFYRPSHGLVRNWVMAKCDFRICWPIIEHNALQIKNDMAARVQARYSTHSWLTHSACRDGTWLKSARSGWLIWDPLLRYVVAPRKSSMKRILRDKKCHLCQFCESSSWSYEKVKKVQRMNIVFSFFSATIIQLIWFVSKASKDIVFIFGIILLIKISRFNKCLKTKEINLSIHLFGIVFLIMLMIE